jgi:hypothetical protein
MSETLGRRARRHERALAWLRLVLQKQAPKVVLQICWVLRICYSFKARMRLSLVWLTAGKLGHERRRK